MERGTEDPGSTGSLGPLMVTVDADRAPRGCPAVGPDVEVTVMGTVARREHPDSRSSSADMGTGKVWEGGWGGGGDGEGGHTHAQGRDGENVMYASLERAGKLLKSLVEDLMQRHTQNRVLTAGCAVRCWGNVAFTGGRLGARATQGTVDEWVRCALLGACNHTPVEYLEQVPHTRGGGGLLTRCTVHCWVHEALPRTPMTE